MSEQFSIKARVASLTSQGFVLDLGNQQLRLPSDALPEGVKEGDVVTVRLLTKELEEHERHERARALLSEILGGGS